MAALSEEVGSSSSLPLLHPRRVVDVPEQAGAVSSSLGRSEASRLKRKTKKRSHAAGLKKTRKRK